jgi:hypothetical protein
MTYRAYSARWQPPSAWTAAEFAAWRALTSRLMDDPVRAVPSRPLANHANVSQPFGDA